MSDSSYSTQIDSVFCFQFTHKKNSQLVITLDHNTLIAIILFAIISLIVCIICCCAGTLWKHSKKGLELEQNHSNVNCHHDIDIHPHRSTEIKVKPKSESQEELNFHDHDQQQILPHINRERSPSLSHSNTDSYTNSPNDDDDDDENGNKRLMQTDLNRQSEPIPSRNRMNRKKARTKRPRHQLHHTTASTHYQNVQLRSSHHKHSLPTIVDKIKGKDLGQ